MKELKYEQNSPKFGKISGTMRVIGKLIYFKSKDNQYLDQVISELQKRGAKITKSHAGWVQVDMFTNKEQTNYKISGVEFDLNETPINQIEEILYDFYKMQYTNAGFKVQ